MKCMIGVRGWGSGFRKNLLNLIPCPLIPEFSQIASVVYQPSVRIVFERKNKANKNADMWGNNKFWLFEISEN